MAIDRISFQSFCSLRLFYTFMLADETNRCEQMSEGIRRL